MGKESRNWRRGRKVWNLVAGWLEEMEDIGWSLEVRKMVETATCLSKGALEPEFPESQFFVFFHLGLDCGRDVAF